MESICFNCESREFAHRIEECARNREDVTLFGVDYTALPLDADGVPVHVGDVMVMANHPFGCENKPLVVDRMELSRGMYGEVWCIALDTDRSCWTQAVVLRHHRAPTVEDVLREFANRVCNSGHQWGLDAADTIAEYAAKLRLAGEDE